MYESFITSFINWYALCRHALKRGEEQEISILVATLRIIAIFSYPPSFRLFSIIKIEIYLLEGQNIIFPEEINQFPFQPPPAKYAENNGYLGSQNALQTFDSPTNDIKEELYFSWI